jgi:hypothetical protein
VLTPDFLQHATTCFLQYVSLILSPAICIGYIIVVNLSVSIIIAVYSLPHPGVPLSSFLFPLVFYIE